MIGYANWAPWRPKDGYRHTVEDSVYLAAGHQGRGLGTELLATARQPPPATRART